MIIARNALFFFIILSFCFLISSDHFYTRDELLYFLVAKNICAFDLTIPNDYKDIDLAIGKDNKLYSPYPFGHSLFAAIFIYPLKNYFDNHIIIVKFFSAILTALTISLIFNRYISLTAERKIYFQLFQLFFLFLLFLSTMWCVYTKTFFSELSALLIFTIIFFYLTDQPSKKRLFLVGILFGLLTTIKNIFIIYAFLIPFFIFDFKFIKKNIITILIFYLLPLLFLFSLNGVFNYLRFANFFKTGYMSMHPSGEPHGFTTPLYIGIYGLLFSAGKSVFLYNPVLLLFFFTKKYLAANYKIFFKFSLAVFIISILIFAKWVYWFGGANVWGPRFLLPAIAPMLICIYFAFPYFSKLLKIIFVLLIITGIIINLPALIFDYRNFTNADNWQQQLQSLFFPQNSPIIRGFLFLINNFDTRFFDILLLK